MRELSLFTGAGGGLLGTKLLGWKAVGYVEWDDYCQQVIAQRIKDGCLDNAPIFGDINTFLSEGYATSYTGMVDVITAGFPCQPFSIAGKQRGADDERNMWPQTAAVIRTVRPRFVLLENVPGLLSHRYFGTILGDLAAMGYDCRWDCVSAAEIGAPHVRERVFIVAYTGDKPNQFRKSLSQNTMLGKHNQFKSQISWNGFVIDKKTAMPIGTQEFVSPPIVCRMDDGLAAGMDRLKAIGNGQVPRVVATAWRLLTE